jgi:hypothetical protein
MITTQLLTTTKVIYRCRDSLVLINNKDNIETIKWQEDSSYHPIIVPSLILMFQGEHKFMGR